MKCLVKITKIFFIVLSILSVITYLIAPFVTIGPALNLKTETDIKIMTTIGEEKSYPIYLVNNLEVDKNGNFYVSCADGIMIYDKIGKPLHHIYIKNDFAFKLEDYQIKVAVKQGKEKTKIYTCDIHSDGVYYDFDFVIKPSFEESFTYCETETVNEKFKSYLKKNDFKSSRVAINNDKTYYYAFYGKVIDSNNNITSLSSTVFPVSPKFSVSVFIFSIVAIIVLKIIQKRSKQKK